MQEHLEISAVIGFSGIPSPTQAISTTDYSSTQIINTLSILSELLLLSDIFFLELRPSSEAIIIASPVFLGRFSNQNFQ